MQDDHLSFARASCSCGAFVDGSCDYESYCCCCCSQGKPSPLLSSFRLSCYTLLNFMLLLLKPPLPPLLLLLQGKPFPLLSSFRLSYYMLLNLMKLCLTCECCFTVQLHSATQHVQGKPSPLLSSFRLSYYTLLNLMKRVEGGTHDLEYVIANSFQQFQQEQAMPQVRL